MGYHRAGFDVVGVDIEPQPRYPFEFHQADALTFPLEYIWDTHNDHYVTAGDFGYWAPDHFERRVFDAIHASPVCKGWTKAKSIHGHKEWYPMTQIPAIREKLQKSGVPYVIENVVGAPLSNPFMLCGTMFGLRVYRHRQFEANFLVPSLRHPRHIGSTNSHRGMGKGGAFVCVAGHNFLMGEAKEAMGIDWMVQAEISQAIPPAYTEFIGEQMLQQARKVA